MQLRLKFFQIGFFFSITPQRKTVSVLLPVKQAPKSNIEMITLPHYQLQKIGNLIKFSRFENE